MLARIFVAIGGTIVLALIAALVAPLFVDWTSYRADFERQASAILGRPVTVAGAASARLIPFPSVTFSDVRVGEGPDGAPAMTVASFSMDAELAPFLSGEILIFDMRIEKPRATVTIGPDGAVDWAARSETALDPARVALEKVTISDGEILLRQGGREHLVRELDAELSAKSLLGPYHAEGALRFDATETDFSFSTGRSDEDGLRVLLRLQPKFRGFAIETDGPAKIVDGKLTYSGAFAVDQTAATQLRGGDGAPVAGPAARVADGWRARGRFSADAARIVTETLRFESGPPAEPYVADGALTVDLGQEPRFALKLDGHQVKLAENANGAARPLADRLAEFAEALSDAPRPPLPGVVSASIPAIVMGDTTLRSVEFIGEAKPDGWRIDRVSAELPGRTTVEGSGFLAGGLTPSFSGDLLVAVAQPSGFAAWLGESIDDAIRRIPAAGISGKVTLNRERQELTDLEVRLGAAAFRGAALRLAPGGGPPSIAIDLDGGALDLTGLTALAAVLAGDNGLDRLSGAALDVKLKAGPVDANGIAAERIDTAMRFRDGRLEVDRLLVDGLAGVHVSATATLESWRTAPTGAIDGSVTGADLAPLVGALNARFPDRPVFAWLVQRATAWPGLLDEARLDFVATLAGEEGGGERQAITAHGVAGGTRFTLSAAGAFAGARLAADQPASFAFEGENDDSGALMALAGLPALPLGQAPAGRLLVNASGKPASDLAIKLALEADANALRFSGRRGEGGATTGELSLKAADIGPWLMTAGVALPGLAEGFAVDVATKATLRDGILAMSTLSGAFGAGTIAGDIEWGIKDGRPDGQGRLSLDAIDASLALRALFGDAAMETADAGWSDAPLADKPLLPFTGDFEVATQALGFEGGAPVKGASMKAAIRPDAIAIADFTGNWSGARLSGMAELRNVGGDGALSLQGKAENLDLAAAFGAPGFSGKADLSLAVSGSGRSAAGIVSSLAGDGAMRFEHVTIAGIDPWAFDAVVREAEAQGPQIEPEAAETLTRRLALAKEATFGPTEANLSIAAGKARVEHLVLRHAAATMDADVRLDLPTLALEATGRLRYGAGDLAVVGAEPEIGLAATGPLGAPTVSVDAEPFGRFLVQRALEKEQARIEALQAALAEKQRLRREVRYFAALDTARAEAKAAEDARLNALAAAAAKAVEEARQKSEGEARRKAEEELKAADEARKAADAERKAAEDAAAMKANAVQPAEKPAPEPSRPQPAADAQPSPADAAAPDVFPEAPKKKRGGLFDFLKPKVP